MLAPDWWAIRVSVLSLLIWTIPFINLQFFVYATRVALGFLAVYPFSISFVRLPVVCFANSKNCYPMSAFAADYYPIFLSFLAATTSAFLVLFLRYQFFSHMTHKLQ